jgi:hypothetical protein
MQIGPVHRKRSMLDISGLDHPYRESARFPLPVLLGCQLVKIYRGNFYVQVDTV